MLAYVLWSRKSFMLAAFVSLAMTHEVVLSLSVFLAYDVSQEVWPSHINVELFVSIYIYIVTSFRKL